MFGVNQRRAASSVLHPQPPTPTPQHRAPAKHHSHRGASERETAARTTAAPLTRAHTRGHVLASAHLPSPSVSLPPPSRLRTPGTHSPAPSQAPHPPPSATAAGQRRTHAWLRCPRHPRCCRSFSWPAAAGPCPARRHPHPHLPSPRRSLAAVEPARRLPLLHPRPSQLLSL
jgi:hypothetical protein